MYDPKKVLTEDGYLELIASLKNIENGLHFIYNHADDLHIGALDTSQQDDLYEMMNCLDRLKNVLLVGDGEIDEDE